MIGNVLQRTGHPGNAGMGAIFIHGGKDHRIDGHIFIECDLAVGLMPFGREHWRQHVEGEIESVAYVRQ